MTDPLIPDTPEPPAAVTVARLDAAGVYLGTEQIPADQVTADHVQLPDGCDLPPGKYGWDRDKRAFVPLADAQQRAVEQPVALNALAWLLLAQYAAGMPLPAPCMAWLDWYVKTIDFGIPGIETDRALLARYLTDRGLT